jgi:hypothetical protein
MVVIFTSIYAISAVAVNTITLTLTQINWEKKNNIVKIDPNSNRKVEGNRSKLDTPDTHKREPSLFWLGRIKSGGLKLVVLVRTSLKIFYRFGK